MAQVGRKPKPVELHMLAGTFRKDRHGGETQKPEPKEPEMPRGLLPPEGRKLWHSLAPQLAKMGLLSEMDGVALTMLCIHYAAAARAAKTLWDDGQVIEGSKGQARKSPGHQILRDNSAALRAYLVEFGLTPSSRSKLQAAIPEEPDLWDILYADSPDN